MFNCSNEETLSSHYFGFKLTSPNNSFVSLLICKQLFVNSPGQLCPAQWTKSVLIYVLFGIWHIFILYFEALPGSSSVYQINLLLISTCVTFIFYMCLSVCLSPFTMRTLAGLQDQKSLPNLQL